METFLPETTNVDLMVLLEVKGHQSKSRIHPLENMNVRTKFNQPDQSIVVETFQSGSTRRAKVKPELQESVPEVGKPH